MLASINDIAPLAAATTAVLAALGGLLKVVLDALSKSEATHVAAILASEQRHAEDVARVEARQEKFLGNHMSGNTRAMERVADKLEDLTDSVDEVRKVVGWRGP